MDGDLEGGERERGYKNENKNEREKEILACGRISMIHPPL